MSRIPLTLRMLVLMPLLAAGVDLTRATVLCGTHAQTCLERAGQGWLGPLAAILVVLYAAGAGVLLARRVPQTPTESPTFTRLWLMATAGLVVATTGQDMLARLLGGTQTLGGNPLVVLAVCVIAGALLALAMRAAHVVADLAATAPRLEAAAQIAVAHTAPEPQKPASAPQGAQRGRAPPAR